MRPFSHICLYSGDWTSGIAYFILFHVIFWSFNLRSILFLVTYYSNFTSHSCYVAFLRISYFIHLWCHASYFFLHAFVFYYFMTVFFFEALLVRGDFFFFYFLFFTSFNFCWILTIAFCSFDISFCYTFPITHPLLLMSVQVLGSC